MEHIKEFISLFTHLDKHLVDLTQSYGLWIYAILFLIIFCETGLVVTPLLPGDSLLFAVGALAATGALDLAKVIPIMFLACVLGDTVNYWVGSRIGPKAFNFKKSLFFNPAYLIKAHSFYEKHGGKTIIMARFVPIVRTFVPFVAGIGAMNYRRFITFSLTGAVLWITSLTLLGYAFGNIPVVKNNFTYVVFGIIGVSILPIIIETIKHWKSGKSA